MSAQLSLARMRDLNLKCKDIRTREVGMKQIHDKVNPDNVELIRRDYVANGGWETFLAYEDPEQDILIGEGVPEWRQLACDLLLLLSSLHN